MGTITHLGASVIIGDAIFNNAERLEISEFETAIRPKFKHKILCQFCLSTIIKKDMY